MASYPDLVRKYKKRQHDTLVDAVAVSLNYADQVVVDLGLLEDTGVLGEAAGAVGGALPFALIAVTEQSKVIMGKKTQSEATKSMLQRMTKTGAALGVGALFFAVGGALAAIPASIGARAFLDKYKSKALVGARVQDRTQRLRNIRMKTEQRMLGTGAGDGRNIASGAVELLEDLSEGADE